MRGTDQGLVSDAMPRGEAIRHVQPQLIDLCNTKILKQFNEQNLPPGIAIHLERKMC